MKTKLGRFLIPLGVIVAMSAFMAQSASAASTKYYVTKDTYIHPTAGTAKDGGPGTTLIPSTNNATCKGDSTFMMSGAKSTPTGYVGVRTSGVTYSGGTSDVGSCRNAIVQYTLPAGINPQSIGKATVNLTANDLSVSYNASKWTIPSLYEVSTTASKCTSWDELTVKGTDIGDKGAFITLGAQKLTHPIYNITGGTAQPVTFDITDYIKAQLEADPTKTEFAFRIAMPTDMVYLFTKEYNDGEYASYIEIAEGADVGINYVDVNGEPLAEAKVIKAEIGTTYAPAAPKAFVVDAVEYHLSAALSTASVVVSGSEANEITFVYEAALDYSIGSIVTLDGKAYRIASANIFANPSFEENTDNWTKRGAALAWTRDDTNSYEGFYSLLNGSGAMCCRMDVGTTEVGKTYFFSTNAYTEKDGENSWYHVSHDLQSDGSSTDYYGGAYNGAGTFALSAGVWTRQAYAFTVPEGSDGSFVFDANWMSATFRYDNFMLYEVEPIEAALTADAIDGGIGTNGMGILRFVTGVSVPDGESVEFYGTYIIPKTIFDNGDDSTKVTVRKSAAIENGRQYSADLKDIPSTMLDKEIYAWSFAKLAGFANISTAVFEPTSASAFAQGE